MGARDRVGQFLADISRRIGAPLRLDDEGVCAMRYGADREFTLEVPEDSDAAVLHAPVGEPPAAGRTAFYERVLALNLYGAQTGRCILGLDTAEGRIVLALNQPIEGLDAVGFENVLAGFVDTAERLRSTLRDEAAAAGAAGPAETAGGHPREFFQNLGLRG